MSKILFYFWALFILFVEIVFPQITQKQKITYLWPTDASKFLTSSFCEYRGRRFHTGIDIKTWGKTGYNVYAVRPGYIWRISVSPFGYGKALYLKLDTGEIAVYAHLSGFVPYIQERVEEEQKRIGRYRINKYFKPSEIPVTQGEIVAFTGQTGIGAPHLHFEIRDARNRPLNPLLKNYKLPDRVKPVITAISFTPLDINSEVNHDYKPYLVIPHRIKEGEYALPELIQIWGKVGVAVACYDKQLNIRHRIGVYSLRLFVDNKLKFQYQFDKVSFQKNSMIDWERDYRLARRGLGLFYKLYKEPYNTLNYYVPNQPWAGVLQTSLMDSLPGLQNKRQQSIGSTSFRASTDYLLPGYHDLRIEITDFFDNLTILRGKIVVGAPFHLYPIFSKEDSVNHRIENIVTDNIAGVNDIEVSYYAKNKWNLLAVNLANFIEKGGNDTSVPFEKLTGNLPLENYPVLKFIGKDPFGAPSYPLIYVDKNKLRANSPDPRIELALDFYDDYVRMEISSNVILRDQPQLFFISDSTDTIKIRCFQRELTQFIGKLDLVKIADKHGKFLIKAKTLSNEILKAEKFVHLKKVKQGVIKQIYSEDKKCKINFWRKSLFKDIYVRIQVDSTAKPTKSNWVGLAYDIEPRDVYLNSGVIIHLKYPKEELEPQKLGVYFLNGHGRWTFIDNKLDTTRHSVWARVFSLEKFRLLRDDIPPEVHIIQPAPYTTIRDDTPKISFYVRDRLSGIASEEEIEIRLDGEKVIAEYDPERYNIFYQVKEPLTRGAHQVSIRVRDRSHNVTTYQTKFWVQ